MKKALIFSAVILLAVSCDNIPEEYSTRGIGIYPGNPDEYFGPEMVQDKEYRNIARNRAVWHSSSYDYNLTGHLITDGLVENKLPYFLSVSSQNGEYSKRDKERIMDENTTNIQVKASPDAFLRIDLKNGETDADKITFSGSAVCTDHNGFDIRIEASRDGSNWVCLNEFKGSGKPGEAPEMRPRQVGGGSQNVTVASGLLGNRSKKKTVKPGPPGAGMPRIWSFGRANNTQTRIISYSADIPDNSSYTSFRILLSTLAVQNWTFSEVSLSKGGEYIHALPSDKLESVWMSAGSKDEWLYIDLGAEASFDKVKIDWICKSAGGVIETSKDASSWKKIADIPQSEEMSQEISAKGKGRYVRLSFDEALDSEHIAISEVEVWGKGGVIAKPHAPAERKGNIFPISGGNWMIQRSSRVYASAEEISRVGYDDSEWLVATVPSTVLSSYYNLGAIPDIRYDDDQLQISESFFNSDFWYRDEFIIPKEYEGKDISLNFDGINWKADIWLNSEFLGHIDGAFMRGSYNISGKAKAGEKNALAVKIYRNDHPGIIKEQTRESTDVNGGALGADNPTFHATIGWDWIPTVRGRDIGIWNDVWVEASEASVTIKDIFIPTDLPLPSIAYAELSPVVTLVNNGSKKAEGEIEISFGELPISGKYSLEAGEKKDIALPPTKLDNPNLWWPTGYGDPYLYDVNIRVNNNGVLSDSKSYKMGVREMNYTFDDDGILDMFVNGRRLIGNGGNWGFPEINYNYRAREYDIAVAYHADMHFTMIRNWVGQTGDEEFYEACDRYGVMVWQDFWLANPVDGPNPYDNDMFLANAEDYIKLIRKHPSIGIYVGRNEGNPPQEINEGLEKLVNELHPGLYYIPNSASGPVSGGGPYRALPVEDYFNATNGFDRFHSERGMPNVMTYESITRMLRPENHWPQTSVWGIHDYTLGNAQSCATFNDMISKALGEPKDLKEFTEYAQWINYNGYRAIFESRSWNRKGLQLWMSHSCWPSMVWQTYDYYFEPTAAYFGAKKGSAPIRIQWNPTTTNVEVVNNNAGDQTNLNAYASIVNYDGKVLWESNYKLNSPEDSTTPVCPLEFNQEGLGDAYFIKLVLKKGDEVVADNFYWEGKENGNYKILATLPQVKLDVRSSESLQDGVWTMNTEIANNSPTPVLMIRLKVKGSKSGESILPAFYEDNYFSLLPGETKSVKISFKQEDTRGERPILETKAYNSI